MLVFEYNLKGNMRLSTLRFFRPQQANFHLSNLVMSLYKHKQAIALFVLFLVLIFNSIPILAISNATLS